MARTITISKVTSIYARGTEVVSTGYISLIWLLLLGVAMENENESGGPCFLNGYERTVHPSVNMSRGRAHVIFPFDVVMHDKASDGLVDHQDRCA
jgi:hypothetical protein